MKEMTCEKPALCVSLTASNEDVLWKQARLAQNSSTDIVEWRVDYFPLVKDLIAVWKQLRTIITKPIIATLRSQEEGGKIAYDEVTFLKRYHELLTLYGLDFIDIELHVEASKREKLIAIAHQNQIAVILSSHYFHHAPSKAEMKQILMRMHDSSCDICKLAIMPSIETDVLNLMEVTKEIKAISHKPLITMAMGELGKITRIQGKTFGSCLTFGMLCEASAPGQIEIEELKRLIVSFHETLDV